MKNVTLSTNTSTTLLEASNQQQITNNTSTLLGAGKQQLHLEQYIRFLKERKPDRRVVYHGIRFHLNEEVLEQIQQARLQGRSLFIKPKFLADLRYYLLFDEYSALHCGIDVSTHYLENTSKAEETVVRSLISLDGDILYQVDRRYLEQPELAIALTAAHYWLIAQLLGRLQLEGKLLLGFLSWSLSLSTIIPYLIQFWVQNRLDLLTFIGMSLSSWVIQIIFRYFLKFFMSQIWRFLLKQMLSGGLSQNYQLKKIIVGILRRLRL
ncbi:MAG: hypothetical protein J7647_06890 [Cyanobacteria bacterium SBLK]|nr:hypothetical protein [Cyanobacteria bacterium SBLK]